MTARKHIELSAEERIKQSAKELFTQKGFEATRTRDIAEKAGINLALLNYYFRSKQKLYEIIMEENMVAFRSGIIRLFGDMKMPVETKIEKIVHYYIDAFIENRDLPAFIISIMHQHQSGKMNDNKIFQEVGNAQKVFLHQLRDYLEQKGNEHMHPLHIITNLLSMIFFPFTSSSILKSRAGLNDNDFKKMMQDRKHYIPIWIHSMMNNDTPKIITKKK